MLVEHGTGGNDTAQPDGEAGWWSFTAPKLLPKIGMAVTNPDLDWHWSEAV